MLVFARWGLLKRFQVVSNVSLDAKRCELALAIHKNPTARRMSSWQLLTQNGCTRIRLACCEPGSGYTLVSAVVHSAPLEKKAVCDVICTLRVSKNLTELVSDLRYLHEFAFRCCNSGGLTTEWKFHWIGPGAGHDEHCGLSWCLVALGHRRGPHTDRQVRCWIWYNFYQFGLFMKQAFHSAQPARYQWSSDANLKAGNMLLDGGYS